MVKNTMVNDSGNELYEWRDGRNKRIYFIKINGRLYQNVLYVFEEIWASPLDAENSHDGDSRMK